MFGVGGVGLVEVGRWWEVRDVVRGEERCCVWGCGVDTERAVVENEDRWVVWGVVEMIDGGRADAPRPLSRAEEEAQP